MVRSSAVLALNSLAQLNNGKHQLIDNGYMDLVLEMLRNETDLEIQLNLIQLLSSLAEAPKGRKKGFEILERLKQFLTCENKDIIAIYAQDAINIITWLP